MTQSWDRTSCFSTEYFDNKRNQSSLSANDAFQMEGAGRGKERN